MCQATSPATTFPYLPCPACQGEGTTLLPSPCAVWVGGMTHGTIRCADCGGFGLVARDHAEHNFNVEGA